MIEDIDDINVLCFRTKIDCSQTVFQRAQKENASVTNAKHAGEGGEESSEGSQTKNFSRSPPPTPTSPFFRAQTQFSRDYIGALKDKEDKGGSGYFSLY